MAERGSAGASRARVVAVFQRLNALDPAAVTAEDLTPEAVPFLRFEAEAQEVFDAWRAALEHRLRAEEDHPVLLSTRLSRGHAVDQMNDQRERGHQRAVLRDVRQNGGCGRVHRVLKEDLGEKVTEAEWTPVVAGG